MKPEPTTLTELCCDPSSVLLLLKSILGERLPASGIIAGPGLAALILSRAWNREIPFDCFDHYTDWLDEPLDQTIPVRHSRPSLSDDDYFSTAQNGFFILSSEHIGKVARHVIQRCQPGFGKDRVMHVLYGLDLNAFGIGFDCYSRKLFMTDAFIEFVRTRQLRIQSPVLAESLLTLIRYRDVFGCYADIQEEIGLLAGFRIYCKGRGESCAFDDFVSAHGRNIYKCFIDELGKKCRIVELDEPIIPGLEEFLDVRYQLEFLQDILPFCHNQLSQTLLRTGFHPDSYVYSTVYNSCVRKTISKVQLKRFQIAMKYPATAYMVLTDRDCLNHDFNEKHAAAIDRFYKQHPLCVRVLLGMSLNLFSMAQAIRRIQSFARRNGNQVIGLIEMHRRMDCTLEEINNPTLEGLITTYRTMGGRPLLNNPVNLQEFEYRELVTELISTTDLECEGWRMKNCVGGYGGVVMSGHGNVRIFHIDGQKPSTAAISHNEEDHSFSSEVAGIANSDPVDEHIMLTEQLGRYLLNTIWKDKDENSEESLGHQ